MTRPTDDLGVSVDVDVDVEPDVEPGSETVVPARGRGRHARSADSGTDVPTPSAASPVTTTHTISAPATTVTTASTATAPAGTAAPSRSFRLPKVPPVTGTRAMLPLALGVGIWILAEQLTGTSAFRAAFDHVSWSWLVVALVVTQLTVVSEAVALSGATTRALPLGDLVRVQSAASLTGLLGGTVGSMATAIRYLRQRGLEPALAYGSGALYTVAGFAVRVVLLVVFVPFAVDQLHRTPAGPSGSRAEILQLVLYAITAAGLVGGLDFAVPRLRKAWRNRRKPPFEPAWKNVDAVASHPGNVFRLLGSGAVTQLVLAAGLAATLHAVGAHANVGGVVLVVCFSSVVAGLTPLPGGIPVAEASYMAGLTLFGVPQDLAVVTTLLFRACTAYLPALWGYSAWRSLRRHDLV